MNYYVYKITNLLNDEYYIGRRQCECDISNDDYMGSGVKIKESIESFGLEYFKKEIIATCNDLFELEIIEGAFINANIINDKCINLLIGKTVTDERLVKDNKKFRSEIKRLSNDVFRYAQENIKLNLDYRNYYDRLEELEDEIGDLQKLNKVKTNEIKQYKKGLNKESKKVDAKRKDLKKSMKIYEENKEIIEQLKQNNLHENINQLLNIDSKNSISKGDIVRLGSDDCLYFVREVKENCVELVFNLCKNSDFEQTETITYDVLNRISFYKINTN